MKKLLKAALFTLAISFLGGCTWGVPPALIEKNKRELEENRKAINTACEKNPSDPICAYKGI
jgi:outer membrane lipopolysaccharide assembly protein LptE/RlpB